jgi:hypothetical protein
MSAHIAKLRPMVDFASLAKLLVRAERETTLCVLQAQLSIATSRHLLARVAAQDTLLSGRLQVRSALATSRSLRRRS